MKKITTYGNIQDGALTISYRDRLMKSLALWPDCRVRLIVEKIYRKRSNPQNAFYWGVLLNEFCDGYKDTTGESCTPEQAHDFLKARFNSVDVVNVKTGEVASLPQSTASLTTSQFMDYQAECVRFISEWFGREVPEPGGQGEMF